VLSSDLGRVNNRKPFDSFLRFPGPGYHSMWRPEEILGNQTTLPPIRKFIRAACGVSRPTRLFGAMPPKTIVDTDVRRPAIAKGRGMGLGPEWQCMSSMPDNTWVTAGDDVMPSPLSGGGFVVFTCIPWTPPCEQP